MVSLLYYHFLGKAISWLYKLCWPSRATRPYPHPLVRLRKKHCSFLLNTNTHSSISASIRVNFNLHTFETSPSYFSFPGFTPNPQTSSALSFVSFLGVSTCRQPLPCSNLKSHPTAFFRVFCPPELHSFHYPAHTCSYAASSQPLCIGSFLSTVLFFLALLWLKDKDFGVLKTALYCAILSEHAKATNAYIHDWKIHSLWTYTVKAICITSGQL